MVGNFDNDVRAFSLENGDEVFTQEQSDFQNALWEGMSENVIVFETTLEKPVYINWAARAAFGNGSATAAALHLHESGFFHNLLADEAVLNVAQAVGRTAFRTHPLFEGQRFNGYVFTTSDKVGDAYLVVIFHIETDQERIEYLRREMNAVITHELRTPLTSIKGALDLLKSGLVGPLTEKAQMLLNIAGSNSDRMLDLIQEILDLSENAQIGDIRESEVIKIAPLLESLVVTHQGYGSYHGVDVQMRPTDAALSVCAVPSQLTKILSNLLSNAVKASERGNSVEIWAQASDGSVAVFVRDHGAGIPVDLRDNLFERFTKASWGNDQTVGSSGLGLNIVRTLIEQLGGAISFETEEGKGTVFRVDMPKHD
ncbi:sensor histidine kinase [Pacificibacter marinus]|uniref:sensor histidine kinase n=1 Tax=Pacificibacter marinus TaxID=658057 RepID=UPI001C07D0ED|nr:HAMP domain-containing sensor histidine kinase [Pacificibacter marinus]MBU2867750.1 HAMP domain-containing histidine kinase [Pacificibacter marinus]